MTSGLYVITHIRSARVYVGQTSDFSRREQEHFKGSSKSCPKLAAAIAKYGRRAFIFTPLVVCAPGDALDLMEERAIHALGGLRGFNLSAVGRGSPMLDPSVARRAGATQRARALLGEHQSQQVAWREQHAVVMREAMSKRLREGTHTSLDPAYRARVSATLRRLAEAGQHPCQREDVRGKISATLKGRVWMKLRGHMRLVQPSEVARLESRGWIRGRVRPNGDAGLRVKPK